MDFKEAHAYIYIVIYLLNSILPSFFIQSIQSLIIYKLYHYREKSVLI